MDAAAEAHGKLVDSLKVAQTSISNTILSNKPDLSSLTAEIRSLFQAQETKIKEQDSKIATLTTLVNGQGTLLHELKDKIKALPTSPSFTSADRETLTKNQNILTSQASLLSTICSTLQQLLTASKQAPAVAEGEKAADKPSSSVPPVIPIEEEEDEDAKEGDDHDDEPSSSRKDGGDDDDDDEDGPSLLSRKITSMAAQVQPATRSAEGEAAEGSQPQGEQ